jgi:PTS system D-glucosamine-specific IIA component/PTS system glucose-specific IIA component
MSIFKRKNKRTMEVLASPVTGRSVKLDSVPDPVFSNKMMGEGMAFKFDGDTIFSPVSGRVIMAAKTGHAFGLMSEIGAEILLHIGMDTVELGGEGFEVLVEAQQKVKVGMPLVRINRNFIIEQGYDLITPMVITNHDEFEMKLVANEVAVIANETPVIEVSKK